MYAGVVIGAINQAVLFPVVLAENELGFVGWLIVFASTVAIFSRLGIPQVTYKFFPYFKETESNKNNGYLSFALTLPIIGVILGILFFILFKDSILANYGQESSIKVIQQYYWLLIPMFILDLYFNILNSYATSLMKASVPIFFRDFFVRLCTLILLVLMWFNIIEFSFFIVGYVAIFGLQCLGLITYLIKIGQFNLHWDLSKWSGMSRQLFDYGLFTLFSGGGIYLVNNIDSLMVSYLSSGEMDDLGIYRVFAYVGIFVMVPARAIVNVFIPVVAKAWKENNMARIEDVYKKTALIQLITGFGLFIIVWANIDNFVRFLEIMKGNNVYETGKYVALYIGLARLIDGATGINGGIISISKYYRYDLVFIIFLVFLTIVSNIALIPTFDMTGAAMATCAVTFFYNLGKFLFVKYKFNLQPFSMATVKTLILGLSVLGLNFLLPKIDHFILDTAFRTIILGGIYASAALYLNLSPDINQMFKKVIGRLKR